MVKLRSFLFLVLLALIVLGCNQKKNVPLIGRTYTGLLFGQPYFIDVIGDSTNYTHEIDSIILNFENTFSLSDPYSVVSRYNAFQRTDTVFAFFDSSHVFGIIYDMTRDFNRHTMQYFDPTTNPLKRAWMISNMNGEGEPNLDSLYKFVGFDGAKIDLNEVNDLNLEYRMSELRKGDPRIELDFVELATAAALDHIADLFHQHQCLQYRLRHGRNVITHGVAIDSLNVFPMGVAGGNDDQLIRVINRAFTYKSSDDKARMIDVTYGYPISNEMAYVGVSSSTLAESVVYAEAFMIMGIEKAGEYYTNHETSEVQSFIFYQQGEGMKNASTEGFDEMIIGGDSLR